jgi:hypothetical protein
VTTLNLKERQTGFLAVSAPAHHVIVTVKIPITNEFPRIRITCRLDKVVVDLNHGGRAPQFPKLKDLRKIETNTTRGSEKGIRRACANFGQTTH